MRYMLRVLNILLSVIIVTGITSTNVLGVENIVNAVNSNHFENSLTIMSLSLSNQSIKNEIIKMGTDSFDNVLTTADIINDPEYVKGKPYKLKEPKRLADDFSFEGELIIDLNNNSIFIPSNMDNVSIYGADASVTAPAAEANGIRSETASVSTLMSEKNYVAANMGLYYTKLDQNIIDTAPNGSVITLLAPYGINSFESPLFVNTLKGKGGVILDKGTYTGSKINYAVAYIDISEGDNVIYYESLQSAANDVNSMNYHGEIHLLSDTKENISIAAYSNIILDLNNHKLIGDIECFGFITIQNDAAIITGKEGIGTGEVTGKLKYSDASHISIKHGIFDLGYEFDKDNLLIGVDDSIVFEDSSGYEISNQWVVLENNISGKLNLNYGLEIKVFESNVSGMEMKSGNGPNLVKSDDNDEVPDLAANKDYKAVIYLKGSDNGVKIRSFDFKVYYDPSLMLDEEDDNINDIIIKPETDINRYSELSSSNGVLHYSMATNSINIGTEGIGGKVAIATFDFKINPNSDSVKVGTDVIFDFERDYYGKTSYIGTMETIHKIPFKEYNSFDGKIKNMYDGVKFYDYAYAPRGYKLAVIADEHSKDETIELAGGKIPVFYTRDDAYVALSSNPYGRYIKPQDNEKYAESGNIEDKFGVYLAFVPDSIANEDDLSYYNSIFRRIDGVDEVILDTNYFDVDPDGNNAVEVNDASIVYQMLRYYASGGTEGEQWGYEPEDGYSKIISAYQRLLAENNHDGKLYGTIEDVISILNLVK